MSMITMAAPTVKESEKVIHESSTHTAEKCWKLLTDITLLTELLTRQTL